MSETEIAGLRAFLRVFGLITLVIGALIIYYTVTMKEPSFYPQVFLPMGILIASLGILMVSAKIY